VSFSLACEQYAGDGALLGSTMTATFTPS